MLHMTCEPVDMIETFHIILLQSRNAHALSFIIYFFRANLSAIRHLLREITNRLIGIMKLVSSAHITGSDRVLGRLLLQLGRVHVYFAFFNTGAIWASVVNAALKPLHPGKETPYALYSRLVGRRVGLYGCRKCRLPPGFDPCTVKVVATR